MFESRLASALNALDPRRMTWVEAESSKVGARIIPPSIWKAMQTAPRVEIRAPLAARAAFLCRAYADLTEDPVVLHTQIDRLRPYHAASDIEAWQGLAHVGDWQGLARRLIAEHYDPSYRKSATRVNDETQVVDLPDLDDATLSAAAKRLVS
jgi:tRNA 2-selenouridine synthase